MCRTLVLASLATLALLVGCDEKPRQPGHVERPANCGNGRLDTGETCDPMIATSSVGACKTSCSDGIACTQDVLIGSADACNAECQFLPIEACKNGDGCCPMGCTGANDNDCSTTCGNSTVDAQETCDGNCPAGCDDNNRCTTEKSYGSAATCSLSCGYQVTTNCTGGDGCCPAGCTSATDSDCSATCGNNRVDANETCDGNCPASCDDHNDCTTDLTTGSAASCSMACAHQRVTSCQGGDGCCAAGCTHANDSDCPESCSTVTACHTGDGCCPSSCTNATDADCPAGPSCNGVTACHSGDGCCPSGCNLETDSDCGQTCSGATCGPSDGCCPVDCTDDVDCHQQGGGTIGDPCTTASGDCQNIGSGLFPYCLMGAQWPGGYCSTYCTSETCPAGTTCVMPDFQCMRTCEPTSPINCRLGEGYQCVQKLDRMENMVNVCQKP